jgi:hypothetical protein
MSHAWSTETEQQFMAIDRRDFLTTAAGGCVAAAAGGMAAACMKQPGKTTVTNEIQFVLTGLGMLGLSTSRKRAVAALVDPTKAALNIPHACLLIVNLDDYVFPQDYGTQGNGPERGASGEPYFDPQIIRVGRTILGVWGLAGCNLWVGEAQSTFDAPDSKASFDFPNTGKDVTKPHKPEDSDWSGIEWFVDAVDVAKAASAQPKIDDSVVTTHVSFTRGGAQGLQPVTDCERRRTYSLADQNNPERNYAAEIAINYPITGDTVDLRIQEPNGQPVGRIIRVRNKGLVSIANSPIATGKHEMTHFEAYSRLLGLSSNVTVKIFNHEYCQTNLDRMKYSARVLKEHPMGDDTAENPPDAGCLMLVFREA